MLRSRDTVRASSLRIVKVKTMNDLMEQWECRDGIAFLKRIGLNPGDSVIDFGCRVGHYSIPAAFAVGDSGRVYALDQDQEALDHLMEKARRHTLENIETIRTSGRLDTGIECNSADAILLYDVLHYFARGPRQTLLRQAFELLKSTGWLSVYPKHTIDDWPSQEFKDLRVSDVEHEIQRCHFRLEGVYEATISHDNGLERGRVLNFRKS